MKELQPRINLLLNKEKEICSLHKYLTLLGVNCKIIQQGIVTLIQ